MLKEELEKIIAEGNIEECSAVTIAQAIIDRLEIDKDKIVEIMANLTPPYFPNYRVKIAKAIAKAKPIKLKESDK